MFAFVMYKSNIGSSTLATRWIILKDACLIRGEHDLLEGVVVDQYKPPKFEQTGPWSKASGGLPSIQIPLIRRTFPKLITNDIINIQPMSGPVGLSFALRYQYGDQFEDQNKSLNKSRYSTLYYTWIFYETMNDLMEAHFADLL